MTLRMTPAIKHLGTGIAFTFLACSTIGAYAQSEADVGAQVGAQTDTGAQRSPAGTQSGVETRTQGNLDRQGGARLQNDTRTQSGINTRGRTDLQNDTRVQSDINTRSRTDLQNDTRIRSDINTQDRNRLQNDNRIQSETRFDDRRDDSRFDDRRDDARFDERRNDDRFDSDRRFDDRFTDERRFQDDSRMRDRRDDDRFDDRSEERFGESRTQFDSRTRIDDRDLDFGARFTTDSSNRLLVRNIERQGVLARAGILANDVIVSVDGQSVTSPTILQRRLLNAQGSVPLVVMRNGVRRTIYLDGGQFGYGYRDRYAYDRDRYYDDRYYDDRYYDDRFYGDRYWMRDQRYSASYEPAYLEDDRGWLGVYLDGRYNSHAVVIGVQQGSPAERAGIRKGDWIVSVNNNRVQSPSHLSRITANADPGTPLNLEVARWDRRQVGVELSDRRSADERQEYTTQRDEDDRNRNVNGGRQVDSDRDQLPEIPSDNRSNDRDDNNDRD